MQSPIQLFSFHSTSKVCRSRPRPIARLECDIQFQGVIGECGRRGGYLEITNIPGEVKEQLYPSLPPPPFSLLPALAHTVFQLQARVHRPVLQPQRPDHDGPHGCPPAARRRFLPSLQSGSYCDILVAQAPRNKGQPLSPPARSLFCTLLCFAFLCELNRTKACRCSQFHEERIVHQPRRRNVRAPHTRSSPPTNRATCMQSHPEPCGQVRIPLRQAAARCSPSGAGRG
jgi:hypothetical protein